MTFGTLILINKAMDLAGSDKLIQTEGYKFKLVECGPHVCEFRSLVEESPSNVLKHWKFLDKHIMNE